MGDNICEDERTSSDGNSWTSSVYRTNCYCLVRTGQWTSWTKKNPGRRFMGCRNFQDDNKDCNYRHWIDPEVTKYYKELIWDLKDFEKKHQNCGQFVHRMEGGPLKVMELEKELETMKLVNLQIENEKEKLEQKHRKLKEKAMEMQNQVGKGKGREQVLFTVIVVLLVLMVTMFMSMSVNTLVNKHMLPN